MSTVSIDRRCFVDADMTAPLLPLRQRSGLAWCAAVAFLLACGRPSTVAAAAVGSVPLAAAKTASRCSAAPDPVECLLRAAAAGIDVLARSVEPVELVPGYVTLVKSGATPAGSQSRSTDSVAADDAATATDDKLNEAGGSAETALIDSITAFVKSRAISVRPPAYLLDSLKSTLTEGKHTPLFRTTVVFIELDPFLIVFTHVPTTNHMYNFYPLKINRFYFMAHYNPVGQH